MENILIVDDVHANSQLIAFILEPYQYKTTQVHNGNDAIAKIKAETFDLVLLDIMMPGIDGIETCRQIKSDPKNADLPILFLSASNDIQVIVSGFEAGGSDYISKPFKNEELVIRIKTHLDLRNRKAQLRKTNEELEKLDEIKNNFLKQFSKNLKQPLSQILKTTYLLKELVESKELIAFINKMDEAVKELEKFSTTALLLNDLNLNRSELDNKAIALRPCIDGVLLQQSANINAKNITIASINCEQSIAIVGDKKLIELGIAKTLEGVFMCYKENATVTIDCNKEHDKVQLIFEIDGQYEDDTVNQLNFERNLPLLLAKLIFKLHQAEIETFKSKKEYLKISFDNLK